MQKVMGWFSKRALPDADAQRLREGLLWMLDAWAPTVPVHKRPRLARLRARLGTAPSPTGLLKELRAIVPQPAADADDDTETNTEPFGEALSALAYAMREVALLDDDLALAIEAIARAVPVTPDRLDAQQLAADAAAVEKQAGPVRARALAERREIARIVGVLAESLCSTAGSSTQLVDGLGQLADNLEQTADPQGLRRLRLEMLRQVNRMHGEAQELRTQLQRAEQESGVLREVLAQQSQQLAAARAEASLDPLTGLKNRGAFDASLVEQIKASRRHRKPMSLVLIDIDHFKSVNDTWGHPVGDQVLRAIADRLRRLLRDGDTVARIGGEEFAIVLAGADTAEAAVVAERIRADIERQSFSAEGTIFRVTLSIGLDALTGNEDGEHLYARVDKALYAAKQAGRNRVMVAA